MVARGVPCQLSSCGGPRGNDSSSSRVRDSWNRGSVLERTGILIRVCFLSVFIIVGDSAAWAAFSGFAPVGAGVYTSQAMFGQRGASVHEPPSLEEPSLMEDDTLTMGFSSLVDAHDVPLSGPPVAAPPQRQRLSVSPRRSSVVGRSVARKSPGAKPEQRTPKHRLALMALVGGAVVAIALQYERKKLHGRGQPRRDSVRSPREKPDSPDEASVVVPRDAVVLGGSNWRKVFATILVGAVLRSIMSALLDYHDIGVFEFVAAHFLYVVLMRQVRRLLSRWAPSQAEDVRGRNVTRMELLPGGNPGEERQMTGGTGGRAAGSH